MNADQAKELRKPFPKEAIGRLPKGGVMLDYVGHAATTDRLLSADPNWTWEPVAFGPNGLPLLDEHGGLWIRLTVGDVTRIGYGDAGGKKGPNAVKEAIGDALRNAAMRFGVALDLWAKEDLSAMHDAGQTNGKAKSQPAPVATDSVSTTKAQIWQLAQDRGMSADDLSAFYSEWAEGELLRNASVEQLTVFYAFLQDSVAEAKS